MRKLVAAVTMLLALSACEMRAELTVHQDGSGLMGFMFLADKSAIDAVKSFGGDLFADMRASLADDPVAWDVKDVSERGMQGIRASFPFDDVADLNAKMKSLDEGESGGGVVEGEVTIEQTGSGWRFNAKGGNPAPSNVVPPSDSGIEGPNPFADAMKQMRISFHVTLPGAPGSNNATKVTRASGSTRFEWTFDATSQKLPPEMRASTTAAAAGGAGGGGLPLGPLSVAVVLLGGIAAALILRRPETPRVPVLEGFPVPAPNAPPPPLGTGTAPPPGTEPVSQPVAGADSIPTNSTEA